MPEDLESDAYSTAPAAQASSSEAQTGKSQPSEASSATGARGQEKTISCVSCRRRKLRCDRIKPQCGTCSRLRHKCEYPERRRNLGSKRRNMKELEERLAQVETRLVAEQNNMSRNTQYTSGQDLEADWDNLAENMDMSLGDGGFLNEPLIVGPSGTGFHGLTPALPMGDPFSQELISLGVQEPLPPEGVMDDLYNIFFDTFHLFMPMIHQVRFFASLDRAPHMRPPVCLLYAIWTVAASMSDEYSCYEDIFYERARRYIQAAEMKGHGEAFVSIYHAQTWGLIGNYEAKKTYFSRSWMSIGRFVRMVHMLGLHRLDGERMDVKQILPVPRDWIELEERRRTFWAAFYGDRWASSGTGWPMTIDEREILTNLPGSEEAFEQGIEQNTISLEQALAAEGASHVSPFGGVILAAALYGHNYHHLHRTGPNENPEDISNGEFWKRHRKMDNVLSNVFMFLPDHLRLPHGLSDMNTVFLHMNIHASSICLHNAAVFTAERHKTGSTIIRQSRARSLMAAEEISNIMRLVTHVDASKMNSWWGFCLYIAGGVFIQDYKTGSPQPQSLANLEFLVAAMKALSKRHPVTKHFVAQLELDIEASGIHMPGLSSSPETLQKLSTGFPNTPMNGIVAERRGAPMTVAEIQNFVQDQRVAPQASGSDNVFGSILPALTGIKFPLGTNVGSPPYVENFSRQPLESSNTSYANSNNHRAHMIPSVPPIVQGDDGFRDLSPLANSDSVTTAPSRNTPSPDISSSNTRRVPYRPYEAESSKTTTPPQIFWPPTGNASFLTTEWTMTPDELNDFANQQAIADPNDTIWNTDFSHN
ncbi:Citrinin biosynthesis transcriptional activator mrl3 [Lachnellula cervina]|uniref:Citrinin biosynthesis transcriptional activator mrl3 n=1 Tax=Lachnellula cervina TaxID=1316786 RepID=A0A7D8YVP5_9HELO|nr:Citrinin biosynthesis transcriptional activator mrl3 [Lachnellula cervina]